MSLKNIGQTFLDIGNKKPVALFGGYNYAAAICSEGEIIFVNPNTISKNGNNHIEASFLPDGEKAVSIAFCKDSLFSLSSNGRVFVSSVGNESNSISYSAVDDLASQDIVWVSGIYEHCFAVSRNGQAFGCGSNNKGKLGLGDQIQKSSKFVKIKSLDKYEIKAAYAGYYHSLFETYEGKVISCGYNYYGQLLLNSGPSESSVFVPTETTITEDATFCIAGDGISIIFIGDEPPPNTPNRPFDQF